MVLVLAGSVIWTDLSEKFPSRAGKNRPERLARFAGSQMLGLAVPRINALAKSRSKDMLSLKNYMIVVPTLSSQYLHDMCIASHSRQKSKD